MVYAYYAKLSAREKAVYRQSDRFHQVTLATTAGLAPLLAALNTALTRASRRQVQKTSQRVCDRLAAILRAPPVKVQVRERRPSNTNSELHGLYEPNEPGILDESGLLAEPPQAALITLWMRTARREQVVAFKTFLRTLAHEMCHHLDYEVLHLEDSFHTEGFFKRESHLYRQLRDLMHVRAKI